MKKFNNLLFRDKQELVLQKVKGQCKYKYKVLSWLLKGQREVNWIGEGHWGD